MKNAYKLCAGAYFGFAVLSQGCSSDNSTVTANGGSSGHAGATSHAGAAGAHVAGSGTGGGAVEGGADNGGADSGGADELGGAPAGGSPAGGKGGAAGLGGSAGTGGATAGAGGATAGAGGATAGAGGATAGAGGATAGAGGATAGAGGATAGAGGDLNAGLILNYKFDEGTTPNIVDSSPNNNTGHVPGFQWVPGKVGNALHVESPKYVSLPAGLTAGVDDFTIGVWVRPSVIQDWARIFDFGIDQNAFIALIAETGAEHFPVLELKTAAGDFRLIATTKLTAGAWQHVTVSQSGNIATMYINGVSVGTQDFGTARIKDIATTVNALGKSKFGDPTFQGEMDEFRMYKRALSAADVTILATTGVVTGAGPALKYSFEDTGATVADSGGTLQNGQVQTVDETWIAGKVGAHAVSLGNGTGYLSMANDVLKNATDFTFAAWVNETAAHNWSQIVDVGSDTNSYFALIASNGDTQTLRVSFKNGNEEKLDGPALVPGTWEHVVVTRKGTSVHLYVNGTSVAQGLFANVLPNNGATVNNWLGRSPYNDPPFEGSLDEVRFYSRALSSAEVTALWGG